MFTINKAKLAVAAVLGSALLGGSTAALASTAATTPAGGTVHLFVNVDVKSQTVQPIVMTGAIGDYGKATSIDKNGKADPDGNYEKIVLKKGAFLANGTALNEKFNHLQPTLDPATCSLWFSLSGPVTLGRGTGHYKGISGTITITESIGAIFPTVKGKCDTGENVQPVTELGTVTGVGKVKF